MNSVDASVANMDVREHIRNCHALVGSDIHFAFQTIIDAREQDVVGFEALVRGIRKEPAALVMSRVPHGQRFNFDQACRIRAIEAAAQFDIEGKIHLNCTDIKASNIDLVIQVTQHVAKRHGYEPGSIVLELHNLESIGTRQQLIEVREKIHDVGFMTLADNFGQRDADLMPVATFRPTCLKLAHRLVEDIQDNTSAQAIASGAIATCKQLGIAVIASGVEKAEEFRWLSEAGVEFFQGYFFAQPGMDEED
jgi:EAL domain-containing protein (putative c-di-GMP-specific phosphodiesterase class I)